MVTASQIFDAIGRKNLSGQLGVGKTAISNAAVDGLIPAKWYPVVKAGADEIGMDCPHDLFTFTLPKQKAADDD